MSNMLCCLLIYFNMYANMATTKMLCWLLIWVPLTYNLNWTQRGWVQGKKPCKNICFYWTYEYPQENPFFIHRTEYICRAEMAKGGSAQATWEYEQLPDRHAPKGWLLSQGQLWRLGKCLYRSQSWGRCCLLCYCNNHVEMEVAYSNQQLV